MILRETLHSGPGRGLIDPPGLVRVKLLWKEDILGAEHLYIQSLPWLLGSPHQGRAEDFFFTWGCNLPPHQVNSLPPNLFSLGGKEYTWGGKEIMIDMCIKVP